ncbi:hypothetical protein [Cryobacterium sp. Y57]|uniref:hypothetical protein n=1 Tax=Cryobacterium sp. Y57 TaxID=2048287 RepID=UPI000CE439B8|nr:hypothetical protein [Cryobacterium sp. Y57]
MGRVGEAAAGREHPLSHFIMALVSTCTNHVQGRIGPGLRQQPGHIDGAAEVELAVEQHAGDSDKTVRIA